MGERWLKDSEFKGIRILAIHTTDASIIHTRDKPMRTLDDFKGMKLRVPGRFVGEAAKALGATPVGIPLPGVYEALARGQVDGMFINWAIVPPTASTRSRRTTWRRRSTSRR